MGKDQDFALVESMKQNYGLVKGNRGCNINSISEKVVCVAAHIIASKIRRKCCANEVPTPVLALAA